MRVDNVEGVRLAEDFLRSSVATGVEQGAVHTLEAVRNWLAKQRQSATMRVRRIPFAELDAWRFDRRGPMRLEHASGRFFTVEGARFHSAATDREWDQPVLNQPEVGLLGFLSAVMNGVPHVLVQAKWEPGNAEMQLSPTVQATRSNYTRAHGGRVQPYIEHFESPPKEDVLFDALMPEHGRFFLRKFNRNVVVRVEPSLELLDNFLWVTLGQLKALLRNDDVVHMDTRSVIACLPLTQGGASGASMKLDALGLAVARSAEDAAAVAGEEFWLANDTVRTEGRPLDGLAGWKLNEDAIVPVAADNGAFSIVAVHVEAGAREVAEWTQPMIEPSQAGVAVLFCARIRGVMAFLVEARTEAGYGGAAQLFPTLTSDKAGDARIAELFRSAPAESTLFSAQNAEEGGRFLGFENRISIVELPSDTTFTLPTAYRWLRLGQLCRLGRQGRVAMELRNVLACLPVASSGH